MEGVLVSRQATETSATVDLTLSVKLSDAKRNATVTQIQDWQDSSPPDVMDNKPLDQNCKVFSLPKYSAFGSGETDEFGTWIQGREAFLSDRNFRESLEDDWRSLAEKSDHTEGLMITSPMSDGFGGLTSAFLEMLRDEHMKDPIFTTAHLSDAYGWKRADTERSIAQRVLNEALSLQSFEELSSIVLPIQPPCSWEDHVAWAKYLRDDLPRHETMQLVQTIHLQSVNSDLREPSGLSDSCSVLNWRGDNKLASLTGSIPLLPPAILRASDGQKILKSSLYDFSIYPTEADTERDILFAQYSIIRGYEGDELSRIGDVLQRSTTLKDPLVRWLATSPGFPILKTNAPVFRSLGWNGRPIAVSPPLPQLPNVVIAPKEPLYQLNKTHIEQPDSVPVLSTLSTGTSARLLLDHLTSSINEMRRVRAGILVFYEGGEYGIGREGISECAERLETLADGLALAAGFTRQGEDLDDDENFPEPDSEEIDWD